MKKFFVSSTVILSFLAYSLYQHMVGVQTMPVIPPDTSQPSPTDSPAPTQSTTFNSLQSPTSTPLLSNITPTTAPILPAGGAPTATPKPKGQYKDGTYTGPAANAFYGNIQVQVTISGGRLTKINFLQYPNDRSRSIEINSYADPILAQEAIQSQNAQVDIVSGATDSSEAFIQSLQSVLSTVKS